MTLSLKAVKRCAGVYMALPLMIFALGWLKLTLALAAGGVLLFGLYAVFVSTRSDVRSIRISWRELALTALVMLVWTHLGGFNGLFYQSGDWPWRNAIFHDLIDYDWPVIYSGKGSALTYYVGFWLPAALLGKAAGALCGEVMAWRVGRGALWLWTALGLMIIWLMLVLWIGADTRRRRALSLFVFVFFSGLDILGALYSGRLETVTAADVMHLEWWMEDGKQFSSITTCLYWVFNQSVVPWMCVMFFLTERDERHYVFLAVCCLCCGPLPCVGLAMCMLAVCIQRLIRSIRSGEGIKALKAIFSPGNLAMLLFVLPLGAYYLGNVSVSETAHSTLTLLERLKTYFTRDLLVFYLLEAGIWLALLGWEHRREALFWCVALSLLMIPFFHLGSSEDFCMRVSIPGVFVLMALCARSLCTRPAWRSMKTASRLRLAALVCALLLGAATPCMEIARGVYHVYRAGTVRLSQDTIGSIANLEEAGNFTSENYEETLFYRMFAKRTS